MKMTKERAIEILTTDAERASIFEVAEAVYLAVKDLKEQIDRKWIPCSERLPDRLGDYLVTNKYGNVYSSTLDYVLDEKCFGYEDDYEGFVKDYTIIAWMPLPEPYRKEASE